MITAHDYCEKIDWLNKNSKGAVSIQYGEDIGPGLDGVYIGFEDPDDALFFKIKYSK